MNLKDYYELLAMHKILLEAKFNVGISNGLVQTSPYTAKFANQVLDEIIHHFDTQGDRNSADDWRKWREFSGRDREKQVIKEQLRFFENDWGDMSEEDKKESVKDLVSPFVASEEEINELLDYANNIL